MNPLKILIKFPTRGRPEKFFKVLDLYYEKAKNKDRIAFLISCDDDDETMNTPQIRGCLDEYKKKVRLVYYFGQSKTKVQAINADVDKVDGWHILLLASDDMIPVVDGYDEIIDHDMNANFPDLDGVLWYNDGARTDINTLSILGRKYYNRFNYIYHPEYVSLWCDNEFTDVSKFLEKYTKSERVIIEHAHPVYQKTNYDALYAKNESFFQSDKKIYEKRKLKNFDLGEQIPLLSILTPSVPNRIENNLKSLMEKVKNQIEQHGYQKKVEHLICIDNRIRTIGRKRDNLVQMALGKYVAFVDDDDDIAENYVFELINAIENNPDVDVITFKQNCFIENYPKSLVVFGLNYEGQPYMPNARFTRKPYHVCAWKRDLAKNYHFPSMNYGEDYMWVCRLWEVAKTEHFIDKILHAYVHSNATSVANDAHFKNDQL
jgi:glycosyltransferase involved in cell wall biosynthesis